jgi:hypothetical protein
VAPTRRGCRRPDRSAWLRTLCAVAAQGRSANRRDLGGRQPLLRHGKR